MDTTSQMLDAAGLAAKLAIPKSWIREQTRRRATDPIPHVRLGRYVRFPYPSAALSAWLERRTKNSGDAQ
jgi:predicted DNA-binding transcriptional regulator AlpA